MRSFKIMRAAALPLFGLMIAACSMGETDEDLAQSQGSVEGAQVGDESQAAPDTTQSGATRDDATRDDSAIDDSKSDATRDDASKDEAKDDLGKDEGSKVEDTKSSTQEEEDKKAVPGKGSKDSKGCGEGSKSKERVLNSSCPQAMKSSATACIQVITYAKNPGTGECCVYANPCVVPQGWESAYTADAACR